MEDDDDDVWSKYITDFEESSDIEPLVVNDPEATLHHELTEMAHGNYFGLNLEWVSMSKGSCSTTEPILNPFLAQAYKEAVQSYKFGPNKNEANHGPTQEVAQLNVPQRPKQRRERPNGLPDGWKVKKSERKNGKTKGVVDKTYTSPTGIRFRSLKQAKDFINKQCQGHDDKGDAGSSGQMAA